MRNLIKGKDISTNNQKWPANDLYSYDQRLLSQFINTFKVIFSTNNQSYNLVNKENILDKNVYPKNFDKIHSLILALINTFIIFPMNFNEFRSLVFKQKLCYRNFPSFLAHYNAYCNKSSFFCF